MSVISNDRQKRSAITSTINLSTEDIMQDGIENPISIQNKSIGLVTCHTNINQTEIVKNLEDN